MPPNIKFRILRIYGLKYPQEIECLAVPRDTENSAWHMDAAASEGRVNSDDRYDSVMPRMREKNDT